VTIATQLGIDHWFYLYIPWFFPLVMLVLLGRFTYPRQRERPWHQNLLNGVSPQWLRAPDEHPISQGSSSEVSKRTGIWVSSDSMAARA